MQLFVSPKMVDIEFGNLTDIVFQQDEVAPRFSIDFRPLWM
jgi:hypothetical protein